MGWTNLDSVSNIVPLLKNAPINIQHMSLKLTGRIVLMGWELPKEYVALEVRNTSEIKKLHKNLNCKLGEIGISVKDQLFYRILH